MSQDEDARETIADMKRAIGHLESVVAQGITLPAHLEIVTEEMIGALEAWRDFAAGDLDAVLERYRSALAKAKRVS